MCFFFSPLVLVAPSLTNRGRLERVPSLTTTCSVVYDDQQGHRSPGGEAATLLARVEALEVFLSLKFPGWREEMAALIKEGQTAEKKGTLGPQRELQTFFLRIALPASLNDKL